VRSRDELPTVLSHSGKCYCVRASAVASRLAGFVRRSRSASGA
jgi:hypothetical protein